MTTQTEENRPQGTRVDSAGLEHLRNLDELTEKMRKGTLGGVEEKDGHRQFTLVRRGRLTISLFHFEEGSKLPEHSAHGLTSFHVLDGQFVAETNHSQQVLSKNDFFVIEPELDHGIWACKEGRALLTIEHTH